MDAFWEGLGDGFRSFLDDFGWILGFSKASNFQAEVGSRKSGSRDARGDSGQISGGPIIDR